MKSIEAEFVGATYGDFLLRPQKGRVSSRRQVRLASRFTAGHDLEIPIVSANMDSVTEAELAKAMALEGGIGIIHRAMPIGAQAGEVKRVKRSHGYVVENPLCLPKETTIREARAFICEHDITGILIEEERGKHRLAGLLSNRDIPWLEGHEDRPVSDFMTPMQRLTTASALSGKFPPLLWASFRRQLCCATLKDARPSCVARLTVNENPSQINNANFPDSTLGPESAWTRPNA